MTAKNSRLKIKLVIAGLAAIAFFLPACGQSQTWGLVWSDEFNGTRIDTSNWTYDVGGGGWGNQELEYYTSRSENAKVMDGNLLIIARHESYGGRDYTSARLKTEGLRSFTYGKITARIKLPRGQGLWPAFWLLGNDITQAGWPECGEVDIMEHIDTVPEIYGTMHWYDNGNASYGGKIACDSVSQFNTYTVEWSPDSVEWFLDGREYWAADISDNIDNTGAFHEPFFIILNMAVGGDWPGNPDSTTSFPDTMFVDYVRVYQLATGINRESEVPRSLQLDQNFPNPFNPTTLISYYLPAGQAGLSTVSNVTLKVYDILGRVVATLVNGRENPGEHTVTFDAAGLSSGVYFYRLQSGNYTEAMKMMLLK